MIDYKFRERELLEELQAYVDSTYDQHYSKNAFQATEFIIDGGHGEGFCLGNVMKYAQRYGKKGSASDARKDMLKILHYALIGLYVHDKENTPVIGDVQMSDINVDWIAEADEISSSIGDITVSSLDDLLEIADVRD